MRTPKRIPATIARKEFAETLNRVHRGSRVILQKSGKDVAAIVSIQDLALLRAYEDEADLKDALAVIKEAEDEGYLSYEQVCAQLGLREVGKNAQEKEGEGRKKGQKESSGGKPRSAARRADKKVDAGDLQARGKRPRKS